MRSFRRPHFLAVRPHEPLPPVVGQRLRPDPGEQRYAGSELGDPDIIEIAAGKVRARDTAWRPPDGAEPESFTWMTWSAQSDDTHSHAKPIDPGLSLVANARSDCADLEVGFGIFFRLDNHLRVRRRLHRNHDHATDNARLQLWLNTPLRSGNDERSRRGAHGRDLKDPNIWVLAGRDQVLAWLGRLRLRLRIEPLPGGNARVPIRTRCVTPIVQASTSVRRISGPSG
jgi:hypothetical protein